MNDDQTAPSAAEPHATGARVSFERLRERTDELELIISGLSLLALLSLPGWLWEAFESLYARMPLEIVAAAIVLLPILSAICYVMATLFLVHLAVRAHWVGLIGLKAVLPQTVRWERLEGIGPITLERLRRKLPSVEQAIARADVVASTLFSLITFSAMTLGFLGAWMALLFLIGGMFGTHLGGTNYFINQALGVLFAVFLLAPAVRWVLDGLLARRFTSLRRIAPFRWLVRAVGFVESLLLPPRPLGLPRLALQSHLSPRMFFMVFVAAVWTILGTSNQWFQSGRGFDVFDSQRFAPSSALAAGHRSRHYESQRVPRDRARPVPMIPSPLIESAWLPVFLPYVALIDDPVLNQRCAASQQAGDAVGGTAEDLFNAEDSSSLADKRDSEAAARTHDASSCLVKLWEVRLDGEVQSLEGFVLSERADLGLRGLTGYLPLAGRAAGPHRLDIFWRARPEQDALVEDYIPKRVHHVIPFVWSPEAAALPAAP